MGFRIVPCRGGADRDDLRVGPDRHSLELAGRAREGERHEPVAGEGRVARSVLEQDEQYVREVFRGLGRPRVVRGRALVRLGDLAPEIRVGFASWVPPAVWFWARASASRPEAASPPSRVPIASSVRRPKWFAFAGAASKNMENFRTASGCRDWPTRSCRLTAPCAGGAPRNSPGRCWPCSWPRCEGGGNAPRDNGPIGRKTRWNPTSPHNPSPEFAGIGITRGMR